MDGSLLSRQLLDVNSADTASAAAWITIVDTPRRLQAAVAARAQDIEIRSHIDLTELSFDTVWDATRVAVEARASALASVRGTRSIRVRTSLQLIAACSRGIVNFFCAWYPVQSGDETGNCGRPCACHCGGARRGNSKCVPALVRFSHAVVFPFHPVAITQCMAAMSRRPL